MPAPLFTNKAKVRIKSDPTLKCAVVDGPRAQNGGWEYEILMADEYRWVDESQLEAVVDGSELQWVSSLDEALIHLLLTKLRNPQTDALYSYRASRTEYEPYQFRPALKFLRNPRSGILIADEVGLGKTIEAAIIYLELKARVEASRVLILCPSRLCKKWQDELQNRFSESFDIWDTKRARGFFEKLSQGYGGELKAITSFETMRNPDLVHLWGDLGVSLDLLIVDEAHNLRNPSTRQHQLGVVLSQSSDAVVFLSATPLHLGNEDLFTLLQLIAPDEFNDFRQFEDLLEPNSYINDAMRLVKSLKFGAAAQTLSKVERTRLRERFIGNPYYSEAMTRLRSTSTSTPRDSDALFIQNLLSDLNTLSSVFTRTRKREMTQAAIRSAKSVLVTLNADERRLYDRALHRTEEQMRNRQTKSRGFGAVMEERQAASCLPAYAKKLSQGHGLSTLEIDISQFDLMFDEESLPVLRKMHDNNLQLRSEDSKLKKLLAILDEISKEGPQSKVLIFSFFRGTIDYLRAELTKRGFAPLVLHGDIKMSQRYQFIEEFKTEPMRQVLISSEVGAEGLDFQFCNVLVNYDLPWNPMQVEQRIGRLDRYGQQSEKIRIYNFFIEDTIETRILERLFNRIEIFRRSIGDLEDILGQEIRQMTEQALSGKLSPSDQVRLADEAAQRILNRQKAREDLEANKDKLLGQGQILDREIESSVNSGRIIAPSEVKAMVLSFISKEFPTTFWHPDDEIDCGVLDLAPNARDHLRRVIERRSLRARVSIQLNRVLGGEGKLRLTFDNDMARQAPDLDFVTVSHPLAVAARDYWEAQAFSGIPCASVELPAQYGEKGPGVYFVYEIKVSAVEESVTMTPIIILDDGSFAEYSSRALLKSLQTTARSNKNAAHDNSTIERLKQHADSIVSRKRAALEIEATNRNVALLAARHASIRNSFDAKITRARRLASEVQEERITRMYSSQALGLEVKRDGKLAELRERREVSVTSRLVLAGTVFLK